MITVDDWFYGLIFCSAVLILLILGYRFARNWRLASFGQQCVFTAVLAFTFGGLCGAIQSALEISGFRWGWYSYSVGVVALFFYMSEPWSSQKKRWGQSVTQKKDDKK